MGYGGKDKFLTVALEEKVCELIGLVEWSDHQFLKFGKLHHSVEILAFLKNTDTESFSDEISVFGKLASKALESSLSLLRNDERRLLSFHQMEQLSNVLRAALLGDVLNIEEMDDISSRWNTRDVQHSSDLSNLLLSQVRHVGGSHRVGDVVEIEPLEIGQLIV